MRHSYTITSVYKPNYGGFDQGCDCHNRNNSMRHSKHCSKCDCHNRDNSMRHSKHCSKCDCLCRILKEFVGEDVIITTKSGNTITGTLKKVTDDCCVKIIEPGVSSPLIPRLLTVIKCEDIESFSVEKD